MAEAFTSTFTRLDLIKINVKSALQSTTSIDGETWNRVFEAGINRQWIEKILIYALDKDNRCIAQLSVKFDWNEYTSKLDRGVSTIAIENDGFRWQDNVSSQVRDPADLFNRLVSAGGLTVRWVCYWAAGVDGAEARRVLGLVTAEPIKWHEPQAQGRIKELPELKIGLYVQDQ